ncbi:MAG: hypothetical protein KC933_04690 [Myxococcales bacterium]|nr:hypothetical protein [Myxococcales bacterium]
MRTALALVVAGLGLAPATAWADQLQCNSKEVAASATAYFPEGSYFLDFCSLCDAKVQVVKVASVRVVESCDFEVEVTGQVVLESSQPFADGYVPGKAEFVTPSETEYRQQLDLAYAYVEVKENDFRWVGGQLGLQATVNTASIQLPPEVFAKLGPHHRPKVGKPVKPAAPVPSTAEVQRVFAYFRDGQEGAVLGHLTACLKLDLKKGSSTRYECLDPVRGPVSPGTEVFAWADWLLPRDGQDEAEVQFVKDDEVRLSRKLALKGRASGPVVPTTAGAKLSQEGIYNLRVLKGGQVISEVSVEVRK